MPTRKPKLAAGLVAVQGAYPYSSSRRMVLRAAVIPAALLLGCAPRARAVPLVGDAANIFAWSQAIQEIRKAVASAIQAMDDALKARIADIDSRIGSRLQQINQMVTAQVTRVEDVSHGLLDKAFRETNDLVFELSQLIQDQAVDLDFRVNGVIVNAMRGVAQLPFVNVRPFIAATAPGYVVEGRQGGGRIEVVGYFRPEWGLAEYRLPGDVKPRTCTMGADNRVYMEIPPAVIQRQSTVAKRLKVRFNFPTEHHYLWPNTRDERELEVTVLPNAVLHYELVSAEADPDWVYEIKSVAVPYNFTAGAGEEHTPQTVLSIEDVGRMIGVDWNKRHELSASSIQRAWLSGEGGNNPTGDNRSRVIESSGARIVVAHYVHGKGNDIWGGGKGANTSGVINIEVQLALKRTQSAWPVKGGQTTGTLAWGQSTTLFPQGSPQEPKKPLKSLILRLVDNSYDPPIQRTLALREAYRSKFVTVESTPERIEIRVRSFIRA